MLKPFEKILAFLIDAGFMFAVCYLLNFIVFKNVNWQQALLTTTITTYYFSFVYQK